MIRVHLYLCIMVTFFRMQFGLHKMSVILFYSALGGKEKCKCDECRQLLHVLDCHPVISSSTQTAFENSAGKLALHGAIP